MSSYWHQHMAGLEHEYKKNRQRILVRDRYCAICGKEIDKSLKHPDPLSATVDHIIPVSKGGHPCDMSNLQLTHRICNIEKGDHMVTDNFKSKNKKKAETTNRDLPHLKNWEIYRASE